MSDDNVDLKYILLAIMALEQSVCSRMEKIISQLDSVRSALDSIDYGVQKLD